jgi:hypothetical protein
MMAVQQTKGVSVPYVAEISRTNPSCFIFLVDQSASMVDPIGGEVRMSKADVVADALNRLLTELAIRCAKEEGVRDYFNVAALGYGGRSAQSAFGALPLTFRSSEVWCPVFLGLVTVWLRVDRDGVMGCGGP